MSDQRRNRRPDSRQMWDESDRRDNRHDRDRDQARGGDRDRDYGRNNNRGHDRRPHRSRSRDRRGPGGRSRSPDNRYKNRDSDRNRGGRDRDRDGPRRHDDRDPRDRRRDEQDGRDRRAPHRDAGHRRSASPNRASPPPSTRTEGLPTRPRQDKKPASMSFKVNRRSASPHERNEPMRDHAAKRGGARDEQQPMEEDGDDDIEVEADDDMAAMQAMLGFGGFGTTKGKKIAGNDVGGVHREKKTEYRQYMNRQGGFNRPLSPGR
jgi:U4/U6.U5 tri-snRNP-associated protein 3